MTNLRPIYADGGGMIENDPAMGGAPAAPAGGAPQGAPQGGDPAAQIEQQLTQYAQAPSPELAVQICDAIVASMGAGGGGEAAPAGPPPGPPMGQNGMAVPRHEKGGTIKKKYVLKPKG